jgi:hypothetical protein
MDKSLAGLGLPTWTPSVLPKLKPQTPEELKDNLGTLESN